jgi:hypothetical protein
LSGGARGVGDLPQSMARNPWEQARANSHAKNMAQLGICPAAG